MPTYTYYCERCGLYCEFNRSIKAYTPQEKCPNCNKKDKMRRDFCVDNVYTTARLSLNEINTVGHYAERQTEQKGKYELEAMRKSFVTKKEEKPLPDGFSKVTQEQYEKMPTNRTRRQRK